jgi:hypothetical protein
VLTLAIREAVLRVLESGVRNREVIGAAARSAMLAGDPNRDQLTLWPVPGGRAAVRRGRYGR